MPTPTWRQQVKRRRSVLADLLRMTQPYANLLRMTQPYANFLLRKPFTQTFCIEKYIEQSVYFYYVDRSVYCQYLSCWSFHGYRFVHGDLRISEIPGFEGAGWQSQPAPSKPGQKTWAKKLGKNLDFWDFIFLQVPCLIRVDDFWDARAPRRCPKMGF